MNEITEEAREKQKEYTKEYREREKHKVKKVYFCIPMTRKCRDNLDLYAKHIVDVDRGAFGKTALEVLANLPLGVIRKLVSEQVGVLAEQAPEVRIGPLPPYVNPLKKKKTKKVNSLTKLRAGI